jgi:hypothetical protein
MDFDLHTFTVIHTALSLVAMAVGVLLMIAFQKGNSPAGWTLFYFVTSIATSATGFGFPTGRILPSHVVGALSLLVLAIALYARLPAHMAGKWRTIYPLATGASIFLLFFVAVAQAFAKIPELRVYAPTQTEPPFAIAEAVMFAIFAFFTWRAARAFRAKRGMFSGL